MRLIKAQHGELDRTDQEIVSALSPYAGIVVTGYKPVQNGQVRDLDLIFIFPPGLLAIEGKGSYGKTGELHWNINGSWDIGGDRTAFKTRPNEQGRKAAQLLQSGTWAGEPGHGSEGGGVCGGGGAGPRLGGRGGLRGGRHAHPTDRRRAARAPHPRDVPGRVGVPPRRPRPRPHPAPGPRRAEAPREDHRRGRAPPPRQNEPR